MSAICNKDSPTPRQKCVVFIVIYKLIIYCIYWGGGEMFGGGGMS